MTKLKHTTNDVFLLRKLFERDIITIPDYLDTKEYLNKMTFDQYQTIIQLLSKLTSNTFLSDRAITAIVTSVDFQLEVVSHYEKYDIQLLFLSDIAHKIEKYLQFALEYELYEIASNITKFVKKFNG
jgi:hypothetical protein